MKLLTQIALIAAMACLLLGIGWQINSSIQTRPKRTPTVYTVRYTPEQVAEIQRLKRETEHLNRRYLSVENGIHREARRQEARERQASDAFPARSYIFPSREAETVSWELGNPRGGTHQAVTRSRRELASASGGTPHRSEVLKSSEVIIGGDGQESRQAQVRPDPLSNSPIPSTPAEPASPTSFDLPAQMPDDDVTSRLSEEGHRPDPRLPARLVAAWASGSSEGASRLEARVWNGYGDPLGGSPVHVTLPEGSGAPDAATRLTDSEGMVVFNIRWTGNGPRYATVTAGPVSVDTPEAPVD